METNNLKFLTLLITFFVGLVTLSLSYFEEGVLALTYQLVSLALLSVSVILIYLGYVIKNNKTRIVSVSKEKKTINETQPKKENDEDIFKKNIISIDLEEDEELSSNEQKVINNLKKNGGSMQQKDVTDSIFKKNKVKAHRVISSLIKKKYIIKRNEGKTNRIFLKKD